MTPGVPAGSTRPPDRRPLALLVAAYLGLGLAYASLVPLWEAPDAVWHYAFAAHLASGRGLPTRADEGVDAPWRQQGSQPPLYYLLVAPLIAAADTSDAEAVIRFNPHAAVGVSGPEGNLNRMVHSRREAFPWRGTVLAARLVSLASLLFGLVAVLATWAAARAVFPARPAVALAAAGILAFNPEILFFSSAISNDIAIAAAGALVLWRAACVLRDGATTRACFWLGLACGLALLTKLSGLWLLPAALGAMAWALWRDRAKGPEALGTRPALRVASRSLAPFALALLAVAGWWYLRNLLLFGDPTGLPLMLNVMAPRLLPPTWPELLVQMGAVWRSGWAVFGWFNLSAPGWVFVLVGGLTLVGLGRLLYLVLARRLARGELEGLALAAGTVGLLVAALVAWAQVRYPQGRLFFPAAPALALLLGTGWAAAWPERTGRRVAAALSGTLGLLSLALLLGLIRPAYRPDPPLAAATGGSGPGAGTAPLARFGDQLELLSARVPDPALPVHAGDTVAVDLVWRALRPPEADYSVFLHLVDEAGLVLAQRDSFPQSGRAPTSEWPAGPGAPPMPDRHRFRIPATHAASCDCRIRLGVYDSATGARLRTEAGADQIELGRLRIAPRSGAGGIPNPLDLRFGDDIRLLGYEVPRYAAPGETMTVTLHWKALRRPPVDYKVGLQLRRGAAETWGQRDEQPADGERSTSEWRAGEIVVDRHPLPIYPEAPPDVYRLFLQMYDRESGQPLPVEFRDYELDLGPVLLVPPPTGETPSNGG